MINLLNEENLEGTDAEDQKNSFDWLLSISEEELRSEDKIENPRDLSATSDVTSLPVTSNSV